MGLWKKKKQEVKTEATNKAKKHASLGSFVSFILLEEETTDIYQMKTLLEQDWGIMINDQDIDQEKQTIVVELDHMMVAISLMPAPIPNDEAVLNASTNIRWPQAIEVAKQHKAHVLVALMRREQPLLEAATLYVKLCASALHLPHATGINTLGSVLAPDFYYDNAKQCIDAGDVPIMNLIFFGLYQSKDQTHMNAYTYGMEVFGKQDMEILDSDHSAKELFEVMYDICSYVLLQDVTLLDGETIGFSEDQKLPITQSLGVGLDGMTLKIDF